MPPSAFRSSYVRTFVLTVALSFFAVLPALGGVGDLDVSSDGSDGAFAPQEDTVIDLSLAAMGPEIDAASPSTDPGDGTGGPGVYDGDRWAVVFKYESVDIPAGVTVTFENHERGAPVVWLVRGDVSIAGSLVLDGDAVGRGELGRPGPGGFAGGLGELSGARGAGLGPGGADLTAVALGAGGGFGTVGGGDGGGLTYGTPGLVPLVGGSGGAGGIFRDSGGAGGGAILIAVGGMLAVDGTISADGGAGGFRAGGGSGGAIRVLARTVLGSGSLRAVGNGNPGGGLGVIQIDAETVAGTLAVTPAAGASDFRDPPRLWPEASEARVRVAAVGGQALVDATLVGNPNHSPDVELPMRGSIDVLIETFNVPVDSVVELRATPLLGEILVTPASFTEGNFARATWTTQVEFREGATSLHAVVRQEP